MLKWLDILIFARYGNPEPERRVEKSEEEWRQILTQQQFRILRLKDTEPPYKNAYCNSYESGTYICSGCGSELFDSNEKYYAISGWPSFTQPINRNAIKYKKDDTHNMRRVEVMCNVCDGHLGHVFPDGPPPGGLRFCINSASIIRIENNLKIAVFGGGCFWCLEAILSEIEGVLEVESGYSGGKCFNPTYKEVSSGLTGHAEVVKFKYDPEIISYENLVTIFFAVHNPSTIHPEETHHSNYRSLIFYFNEEQKDIAEKVKQMIEEKLQNKIFTEILPYKVFYKAEEKHQQYYKKNPLLPYCTSVIDPKLIELRKILIEKLKKEQ